LLIGDAAKTKALVAELAAHGYLVTGINYPVVPKGKDEIRVQLSAAHSDEDVDEFLAALAAAGKKLKIMS
jgi:glycine C-acetyltransferase